MAKEKYIIKGIYYKKCSGNSLSYTGKKAYEYENDIYANDKEKAYELLKMLQEDDNPYRTYKNLRMEIENEDN